MSNKWAEKTDPIHFVENERSRPAGPGAAAAAAAPSTRAHAQYDAPLTSGSYGEVVSSNVLTPLLHECRELPPDRP